jgi:hypothetical protein
LGLDIGKNHLYTVLLTYLHTTQMQVMINWQLAPALHPTD